MLPLLGHLEDKSSKNYAEISKYLTKYFNLSNEDLVIQKPSGGNSFSSRIGWAKTYLARYGLLERNRGIFKITDQGLNELHKNPERIDRRFLLNLDKTGDSTTDTPQVVERSGTASPDDLINDGIEQIDNMLKMDLLEKLKNITPSFFEEFVTKLIEHLGYGHGIRVGKRGDEGIDGEILQDELGFDVIYLQAKRLKSPTVPAHDLRDFLGALQMKNAKKGIFITTSSFTKNAYKDVNRSEKRVVLMDGGQLVDMMLKHKIGIRIKIVQIKKIDEEFFEQIA